MYLSLHKAHGDRNHQPYANKKGRPKPAHICQISRHPAYRFITFLPSTT